MALNFKDGVIWPEACSCLDINSVADIHPTEIWWGKIAPKAIKAIKTVFRNLTIQAFLVSLLLFLKTF